jgi:hypothetical protein
MLRYRLDRVNRGPAPSNTAHLFQAMSEALLVDIFVVDIAGRVSAGNRRLSSLLRRLDWYCQYVRKSGEVLTSRSRARASILRPFS